MSHVDGKCVSDRSDKSDFESVLTDSWRAGETHVKRMAPGR